MGGMSILAELGIHALDRDERDTKSPRNLGLGSRPIGHQLTGEQAKRGYILAGMREDRQVSIKVNHPITDALEPEIRRDEGARVRKDRKLKLGHPTRPSQRRAEWPAKIGSFQFHGPAQSPCHHGPRSGCLRLALRQGEREVEVRSVEEGAHRGRLIRWAGGHGVDEGQGKGRARRAIGPAREAEAEVDGAPIKRGAHRGGLSRRGSRDAVYGEGKVQLRPEQLSRDGGSRTGRAGIKRRALRQRRRNWRSLKLGRGAKNTLRLRQVGDEYGST
jgi:hypothetical protein